MKQVVLLGGAFVLCAAGCGNEVTYIGAGGSGSGGHTTTTTSSHTTSTTSSTTTDGGAGGSVPGCSVPTGADPPFFVEFRITSVDGPVYLRQDCAVELSITSCMDDYAQPLSIGPGCTVDCVTAPDDCMLCEPCLVSALPVGNGDIVAVQWTGYRYTLGTNPNGCPCSVPHEAPAAHYRISVPVYSTEAAAISGLASWTVETDFTLPNPGPVYVSLMGI
jgi:hypothetical protein